jgi:hypothetical protein
MHLWSLYMFVALARYVLFSHTIVTFLLWSRKLIGTDGSSRCATYFVKFAGFSSICWYIAFSEMWSHYTVRTHILDAWSDWWPALLSRYIPHRLCVNIVISGWKSFASFRDKKRMGNLCRLFSIVLFEPRFLCISA